MASLSTSSSSSNTGNGRLVLVTGATGYIATALVSHLLSHGYRVRGTVRSLTAPATVQFRSLFPSVSLFVCDLLSPASFPSAISGCSIIFHCASPFFFGKSSNPQKDFVDPAVKGTENVLRPAFEEPSVERIIVTSSVAAMARTDVDFRSHIFSESDWNTTSSLRNPYLYSKFLAERRAWELFSAHRASGGRKLLFCINPGLVLGPPSSPRSDAESIRYLSTVFEGAELQEGLPASLAQKSVWVDVRDVVAAHRIAGEKKDLQASRYLLAQEPAVNGGEIAEVLEKVWGNKGKKFQKKFKEGVKIYPGMKVDNSKARKELGIQFIGLETSIKDMTQKMVDYGILKVESSPKTKAKL